MTPQAEKLLPKIEKAGIKASLKVGHPLNREELLEVKVQLLPLIFRWTLGGFSAASVYGSYSSFCQGCYDSCFGPALLALVLFLFSVVGIRRTLGHILQGLDAGSSAELVELVLEGISSVIGSLFDAA